MAISNINFVAEKMQGEGDKNKIVVTVWADEADWLNVQIQDDAELGALLMDAVVDAIEGVAQ